MTDRELLEAAARAMDLWPSPEPFEHVLSHWNPLVDDGDALRLAVRVGMQVNTVANSATLDGSTHFAQAGERDGNSATRRAIVRAAAAMAG